MKHKSLFRWVTTVLFVFPFVLSHAQDWGTIKIDHDVLDTLSPPIRMEIAGLQYLLNARQLHQLVSIETEYLQRQWIEKWWRSKDPTPETVLNEMLVEHEKRVAAARINYRLEKWPGWDHRGEIFIRYGAPDVRQLLDWDVGPLGCRPPGESWFYNRLDMTVLFEDYALTGRYTFAMNSLGNPDRRRVFGGMESVSGNQQGVGGKPVDADFDPPRANMPRPPTNWYYVHLSQKAQDRIYNFQGVLEDFNAVYPFNYSGKELPFFFGVGQFKGGGPENRVDVFLEFPADPEPMSLTGGERKFTATAVFFDTDYREIDRKQTRIELPPAADLESAMRWLPAQLVFSLSQEYCRMAVTIEEEVTGRRSSYRANVTGSNFEDNIAISDIVFCSRISQTAKQSRFNRGSLEVIPHPQRDYRLGAPVPIYFEMYNLDVDDNGVSNYEIEYWIVSRVHRERTLWFDRKDSTAYAASEIAGSAYGVDVPINITIDTDNLWEGEFAFHVKVTDTRTLFMTERSATFNLVEVD